MRAQNWLWMMVGLGVLLACRVAQPRLPAQGGIPERISEGDLESILALNRGHLDPHEWALELTATRERLRATWSQESAQAVFYIDIRVYPQGYSPKDVAWYYQPANFSDILYKEYQDLTPVAYCEEPASHQRLYLFTARYQGQDYRIRHWVLFQGAHRIWDAALIFPARYAAEQERYARALFPGLPTCK